MKVAPCVCSLKSSKHTSVGGRIGMADVADLKTKLYRFPSFIATNLDPDLIGRDESVV